MYQPGTRNLMIQANTEEIFHIWFVVVSSWVYIATHYPGCPVEFGLSC